MRDSAGELATPAQNAMRLQRLESIVRSLGIDMHYYCDAGPHIGEYKVRMAVPYLSEEDLRFVQDIHKEKPQP